MRIGIRPLIALLFVAALAACGEESVDRRVGLEPDPALPAGSAAVAGSTVHVTTEGLEPLEEGSRYVVWAETADGAVALGGLSEDGALSASVAGSGADIGDVLEITVSEEDAEDHLPAEPSHLLRLAGSPGGALSYTPIEAHAVGEATGMVRVSRNHFRVMTSGLPDLPEGLSYAVWMLAPGHVDDGHEEGGEGDAHLTVSASTGDGHDDEGDGHDDEGDGHDDEGDGHDEEGDGHDDGPMHLGHLPVTGVLEGPAGMPHQTAGGFVVTIESERGHEDEMSPVVVLRGELHLPESGPSEGGGHVH